jgi:hypothetical protein
VRISQRFQVFPKDWIPFLHQFFFSFRGKWDYKNQKIKINLNLKQKPSFEKIRTFSKNNRISVEGSAKDR